MNLKIHTSFYIQGLFVLMLGASAAHAMENLHYNNVLSRSSAEKINAFTAAHLGKDISGLDIAEADLNGDGLNEFIVRTKDCAQTERCNHIILGETDDTVLDLGKIEALRIMLGNDYEHGVRNLLVFDNPENDFAFTLYRWDDEQSRYGEAAP
ncbi:MAG: hypothetical protein H6861_00425 [Rhodospirillales bacterium]|nr:hypothetical protein [Rhodospirillales bacterium]